ncbi:MAG: hypothetical protein AAB875_05250 [Patescibacteria group bacterium]
MKILNEKQVAHLKPVVGTTPRAKARGKVNRLEIGEAVLLTKADQSRVKNPRTLVSGLKGNFSIRKYRDGVVIQKVK